jgi:hypothetical protein
MPDRTGRPKLLSDLKRRKNQPSGRVHHDVDRNRGVREVNRSQHFFRMIHVDEAEYGKSQKAHRLLPVHEEDDAGAPLPLGLCDEAAREASRRRCLSTGWRAENRKNRLEYGLERGEQEEQAR